MSDNKSDMTQKLLNIPKEKLKHEDDELPEEVKLKLEKSAILIKKSIEPIIQQTKSISEIIKQTIILYNEVLKNICEKLNINEKLEDKSLKEISEIIRKHITFNKIDINSIDFTEIELIFLEDILGEDYLKKIYDFEENIKTLQSKIPKNFLIHNNINKIAFTGTTFNVNVGTEKKQIHTKVLIDYKDKNIKLPSNFTTYDKVVFDAIITLYEAGNNIFTADMVFRCMNGLTNKEKPTPQQKGAVTKSIEKMRFMHCEIDYTEEANARLRFQNKEELSRFKIEGYFLNADKITIAAGGKPVEAYFINKKPILYEYAQFNKQIINVPLQLLNTKQVVSSTDEIIVIREYLISRIESAKNGYLSNKITYEAIFEQVNLVNSNKDETSKKKITRLKKSIKKILEWWKTEKYIKDYKEYKENRAIKGIEIIF